MMTTEHESRPMRRRTDVPVRTRMWDAVRKPHRWDRFKEWRKSEATVTRGYLAFRDFIVIVACTALVISGVTAVRNLRRDDCVAANQRRTEIEQIALTLLNNDRRLLEIVDDLSNEPLPPTLAALIGDYDVQRIEILAAYAPSPCPDHVGLLPWIGE